ncbi:MAG: hypothetical protein ABEH38_09370, partial [Flavobacteriales bacterium]
MEESEEAFAKGAAFQKALLSNLALKAKVLFAFFLMVFFVELGIVLFSEAPRALLGPDPPVSSLYIFPAFLLFATLSEGIAWRYFKKTERLSSPTISAWVPYGIALIESLFPTLIMFLAIPILIQSPSVDVALVLNTPPVFVYFFFIILSALHLELRLSVFTGFIAGIGYLFITLQYLPEDGMEAKMLYFSGVTKSCLFLVGGGLAGLISKLIKDSIEQSLEAKDQLIHRLDEKVEEKTQELKGKNELLENRNKEITDSIDYARRIQNALLQHKNTLSQDGPEHFILLKPQEQVSGDFYWIREQKGHLYIAAVDCTGHGVPGAFMSMLGISQLDEIMSREEELKPGEILTELRERVVRELSGSDPESTAKDGMDAALVRIPLSKEQGVRSDKGEGKSEKGEASYEKVHPQGEGFNPHL